MNRLYKIVAVVLLSLGLIGGCGGGGGGDDACDFVLSAFFNGANANQATSLWDCVGSSPGEIVDDIEFQAFEDGTGFSTGVGVFTFQQTGCRSLNFQSGAGNATVSNIQGSINSGFLTFFQSSSTPELDDISAGCILVIF